MRRGEIPGLGGAIHSLGGAIHSQGLYSIPKHRTGVRLRQGLAELVEATLNKIFAGSRDEVPFSELYATITQRILGYPDNLFAALVLVEPRVAQAGRGAVEETLVDMEAADKVMHREGRVHLI